MTPGDWIFTTTGALLALAGLTLLAWSLFADRLRTRRARREGTLRRCPRCWYDMASTPGLTCPECGRTPRTERALARSRRRYRPAAGALAALALAAGLLAYPHTANGAWKRWLPDTAVILLIPHTNESGWAAAEMSRRLGMWSPAPSVSTGDELAPWQWRLLSSRCAAAIERSDRLSATPAAWWLIVCASPTPEAAFDALVASLERDDPKLRQWAAMNLDRTRFFLSDAQLAEARDAILAAAPMPREFEEERRIGHAAAMDRQLRSRAAKDHDAKAVRTDRSPLSPDSIAAAIDGRTINELIALHRRLGVRRTALFDTDELRRDAIEVERFDLPIDGDDLADCILLVSNRHWNQGSSNIHYEGFVLLRRGDGWRFAGMLDLTNNLDRPPRFDHAASGGARWLIVERSAGSSGDGTYETSQHAWYRVRSGRLTLEQAVMPRSHTTSPLRMTLDHEPPRVTRRASRALALYDVTHTIALPAPTEGEPDRVIPIAQARGTFEYPLGVAEPNLGAHTAPGPWQGRGPTWAILGEPADLLTTYQPQLLALARSSDPDTRAALQSMIDFYSTHSGPIAELEPIQRALDNH